MKIWGARKGTIARAVDKSYCENSSTIESTCITRTVMEHIYGCERTCGQATHVMYFKATKVA